MSKASPTSETPAAKAPDHEGPRSVGRFIGLFETIAAAPEGHTLAELSVALEAPKSSLLTLLRPFVARKYLAQVNGRYQLGPAMFQLASRIMSGSQFPSGIHPFMEELVARSGETALLVVKDEGAKTVSYIDAVDSPQAIRYTVTVGITRPLYCSAAGLLLLAYSDETWRENYLKTAVLKPLTPKTVVNRAELRRRLEEVRRTGIAVSIGEAVAGAAGIAAPIFQSDGSVAGALLLGGPTDRVQQQLKSFKRHVEEVAAKASAAIGYRPPGAPAKARRSL